MNFLLFPLFPQLPIVRLWSATPYMRVRTDTSSHMSKTLSSRRTCTEFFSSYSAQEAQPDLPFHEQIYI